MYASSGVFGGDCTFKGTLDGADGSFSGTLNGVDGTFSGNISGSSGTFGDVTLNNEGISSTYFKINSSGAYIDGIINAGEGSQIGGWTITNGKIYGGDSYTGVAVMQKPSSNTTYVFAAGGKNHNSYADCPFRVTKDGKLYASKGKISEFNITDNGLEWSNYGTKIWGNTIKTVFIETTSSSSELYIGEKTKPTYIYGKEVYVNDDKVTTNAHLEKRIDDLQKWVRNNFKTK